MIFEVNMCWLSATRWSSCRGYIGQHQALVDPYLDDAIYQDDRFTKDTARPSACFSPFALRDDAITKYSVRSGTTASTESVSLDKKLTELFFVYFFFFSSLVVSVSLGKKFCSFFVLGVWFFCCRCEGSIERNQTCRELPIEYCTVEVPLKIKSTANKEKLTLKSCWLKSVAVVSAH